jgi:alpha-glucosidase
LGGIAARHAREIELPLSFLGAGRYTATVWKDAPDAEVEPNHLITQTLSVSASDRLKLRLALDGGFVAQIAPAAK